MLKSLNLTRKSMRKRNILAIAGNWPVLIYFFSDKIPRQGPWNSKWEKPKNKFNVGLTKSEAQEVVELVYEDTVDIQGGVKTLDAIRIIESHGLKVDN